MEMVSRRGIALNVGIGGPQIGSSFIQPAPRKSCIPGVRLAITIGVMLAGGK